MEQIEQHFGEGVSLYDVLGVTPSATAAQLKKAYYKAALSCHPDKNPGDLEATARFQALTLVHATLSQPESRQLYDETGELGDGSELGEDGNGDWAAHWRAMFPKVTVADIEAFGARYKGSAEERADVITAYARHRGDWAAMLRVVLLSDNATPKARKAEQARFAAIVEAAIAAGDIERSGNPSDDEEGARGWVSVDSEDDAVMRGDKRGRKRAGGGSSRGGGASHPSRRRTKQPSCEDDKDYSHEAEEAEAMLAELMTKQGLASPMALMKTGQQRGEEFDRMCAGLLNKYGDGAGGAGASTGVRVAKPKKTKRQHEFEGMCDALEAKYCGGAGAKGNAKGKAKGKKGKRRQAAAMPEPPSEADFLAAQARILKRRNGSS